MNRNQARWMIGAAALVGGQALAANYQVVEPAPATVAAAPGETAVVAARYDTSDANPALTGLGLRLHFTSSALRWVGFDRLLPDGLMAADAQPVADTADYDGDPATDAYVAVAWVSVVGQWPAAVPTDLLAARFEVVGPTPSRVNFSASSTAAGYTFQSNSAVIAVRP